MLTNMVHELFLHNYDKQRLKIYCFTCCREKKVASLPLVQVIIIFLVVIGVYNR